MNVIVDGIAGELHLAKAQMSGRRFGDVHDFAVGRDHKYETVECLQQIRAELFDGGHSWICWGVFWTPGFAETCNLEKKKHKWSLFMNES